MDNAAKNKHVYKNYSRQIVPLFTFWGLKHNHNKVNKPVSMYLSVNAECMHNAPDKSSTYEENVLF